MEKILFVQGSSWEQVYDAMLVKSILQVLSLYSQIVCQGNSLKTGATVLSHNGCKVF